jgi:hypothetical protein
MGIFAVSGGIALFMPDILNKLAIARQALGYDNIRVCDIYDIPKEIFSSVNESDLESSVSMLFVYLNLYYNVTYINRCASTKSI